MSRNVRIADGGCSYRVSGIGIETTGREIAKDFMRGYDTNGEPIGPIRVWVYETVDGFEDCIYEGDVTPEPNDASDFNYG